jgi:hypothetical protein
MEYPSEAGDLLGKEPICGLSRHLEMTFARHRFRPTAILGERFTNSRALRAPFGTPSRRARLEVRQYSFAGCGANPPREDRACPSCL